MNLIKKSFLLFLFLAGILLTASTLNVADQEVDTKKCSGCSHADKCKIEVPTHGVGRFFKDQLGLNNQQHVQFREFRQAYHVQRDEVIKGIQAIRTEMFKQLDKNNPNRSVLNEMADKEGALHAKLKVLSFDHYEKMRSVLNNDQQKKLVAIYKGMMENEQILTPHGSHGEGEGGSCGNHEGDHHAKGESCGGDHKDCHSSVTSSSADVFEEFHQN